MEVCRVVTKVIATGIETRGQYVFTPRAAVEYIRELTMRYGENFIHWVECLKQAVS